MGFGAVGASDFVTDAERAREVVIQATTFSQKLDENAGDDDYRNPPRSYGVHLGYIVTILMGKREERESISETGDFERCKMVLSSKLIIQVPL